MDLTKPKLNLDANYSIAIPAREAYPDILDRLPASSIQCYTDGSKLEEKVGAGFVIYQNNTIIKEEALHLGAYSTVFQAETTAVLAAASYLLDTELKDKEITILCDSQATLMALDATKIRARSIQETAVVLNALGEHNILSLLWIPAHSNYEGNERADTLAKKGSLNEEALIVNLPIPQATWKLHTHQLVANQAEERWKSSDITHFKIAWRDKYTRELTKLSRSDLRIATQLLTGHAAVNNHLHKYKPRIIT
jgi:ribonuclease HI